MAPASVTGGVTLSDPDAVCESAAEGRNCQERLVGRRPETLALPSAGARGSPSGSWEGWGSQLWSSMVLGLRVTTKSEQGCTNAHKKKKM